MRAKSLLLTLLAAALMGCDEQAGARIEAMQKDVDALTVKVNELQTALEEQKQNRELNELIASFDKIAYLTPGAEGYTLVSYDLGVMTVQLTDVKPYANGSRVIVKFGNPHSATVTGLKLTVDWGKVTDKGIAIQASQKSKELTLTQEIRGGAWTAVPIVLDGLPPAELGFVRVHDVSHTGVRLIGR